NGVLRNILRQQEQFSPGHLLGKNEVETLSIRYSYPLWMVDHFIKEYGMDTAEKILASSNEPPHSSIRVNKMKQNANALMQALTELSISAKPSPIAADGLIVEHGGHLASLDLFKQGLYSMQDESSMLVAEVL